MFSLNLLNSGTKRVQTGSNLPPLVLETMMLSQRKQDRVEREGLLIVPITCFNDLQRGSYIVEFYIVQVQKENLRSCHIITDFYRPKTKFAAR